MANEFKNPGKYSDKLTTKIHIELVWEIMSTFIDLNIEVMIFDHYVLQ